MEFFKSFNRGIKNFVSNPNNCCIKHILNDRSCSVLQYLCYKFLQNSLIAEKNRFSERQLYVTKQRKSLNFPNPLENYKIIKPKKLKFCTLRQYFIEIRSFSIEANYY